MIDEFEKENKDLKKPTILGMIDAKPAFDVVRRSNLIRKLHHLGLSEQSVLLIDSLYTNATTKIKWNGQLSESFDIEQGVQQGLTQTTKEYFHKLGDNVILLCTIEKAGNPIEWVLQFNISSNIPYSSDNNINPFLPEEIRKRLSIVGNYDLQISTIKTDDGGSYECTSNKNGVLEKHLAILSIVTPPTEILIQNVQDNKVSGTEGQILALNCTALGGKPPPVVKLTVSGVSVLVTGNQSVQYTNRQVPRDFDRQTVTCTVNHSESSTAFMKTAMIYLNCSSSDISEGMTDVNIFYASPETLVGDPICREVLQTLNLTTIVIDDFHTIATWGGDIDGKPAFRKWFQYIHM
ncbi:unnamed protein product [Mytilus coruscus]|uniref:Ig-like domain-containing protein n=1 Tax=Mytilus coruscus TaxID=42192 RepID=A0A6J7ZYT1_MYTCO|nr:unnamed protein product [Mytilus coruscus]